MLKRLPVLFRSTLYAFRGGFLIRPLLIVLALGTAGAVLSAFEEQFPAIRWFVPQALFPSQADPQVAQAILTSIATSTMTVVSIVFAILLDDADPGLDAVLPAKSSSASSGTTSPSGR